MDKQITITICGDGGCGKSSITLRIVRGQWTHEYDPTIEDSYSVTRTVDGTTYNIQITDTAGQEEYRSMWSAANMHSDAFLLVYDITSHESLRQLTYFTNLIDAECQNRAEAGVRCMPALMIVGNKCDLQGERRVQAREGLEWARARGYGFMETSAREMVNIEETVSALVKRVVEARRMHASGQTMPLPSSITSTAAPGTQAQAQPQAFAPSDYTADKAYAQPAQQGNQPPGKKQKGFWASLKCW